MSRKYDVFLSYDRSDAEIVQDIAFRLENQSELKVWLDQWILVPGEPWQQNMAKGISESNSAAVFFGASTPKGWFKEETERALNRQAQDPTFRVIPVLLPGSDTKMIDDFLALRTWVDFRKGVNDSSAFYRLMAGIRGKVPGANPARDKELQISEDVADILAKSGVEFSRHVFVGESNPDFYMISATGSSSVFEVKTWEPSKNNIDRASRLASKYEELSGVDHGFVLIPGLQNSIPDMGVVSISDLSQVVSSDFVKEKKRKEGDEPEIRSLPDKIMLAAMPFSEKYDDTFVVAMQPASLDVDAH